MGWVKTRYPLYKRLSGPQGRSGRVRKILPPTGIRSPGCPARTDWATPALARLFLKSVQNSNKRRPNKFHLIMWVHSAWCYLCREICFLGGSFSGYRVIKGSCREVWWFRCVVTCTVPRFARKCFSITTKWAGALLWKTNQMPFSPNCLPNSEIRSHNHLCTGKQKSLFAVSPSRTNSVCITSRRKQKRCEQHRPIFDCCNRNFDPRR